MLLEPASVNIIPELQTDAFLAVDTSLSQGIYKTTYASSRSPKVSDAILIVKQDGAFLLIGTFRPTIFTGDTPNYEFFAPDTPEDDSETTESDDLSIGF